MAGQSYTVVPALLDGLVGLFSQAVLGVATVLPSAPDGTAVEVVVSDGPPDLRGQIPDYYVAVGYSATGAAAAYTGTSGLAVTAAFDISDVGNRQLYEYVSVECECSTFSGDADRGAMSRQRARTGVLFSALAKAIQDDPTVGGAIGGFGRQEYACLGGVRWLDDTSRDGTAVSVQFAVRTVGETWVPR